MIRICVAGGDGRMDHTARALQKEGYAVIRTSGDLPPDRGVVVLPVRGNAALQAQLHKAHEQGTVLIGGMLPTCGERCFDYMKDETFLYENARITAEGAVMLLASQLERTLYGTEVGVIGMGRIGECLCAMLSAWHVRVTVYARRHEVLARARMMGADTVCFSDRLPSCAVAHDAVFNTVPHLLFDAELLAHASRETVLVELASLPGGFDTDAVARYGLQVIDGQGIPGRYAPRTAGELIAKYVSDVLRRENKV